MSKSAISIEGFISNELEVREAKGHRIVDVTVPVTPQKKTDTGWEDSGPTTWFEATFWDEHADAVIRSVEKGQLVTLSGVPQVEAYLKRDQTPGAKVTVQFPVLAVVVKRPKRGEGPALALSAVDGWNVATPAASGDVWNQPDNDSTPF